MRDVACRFSGWARIRRRVRVKAGRSEQCRSMARTFLAFQRDWTRQETYEAARAVVVANGGGYGLGLAYAREMIHPG
jgi:hypothetical protein